jgi:thiol-disulfide isomerase/thioredoxin
MYRLAFALMPVLLGQPDPGELVRQSGEAIKRYKSYQLESIVSLETRGGAFDTKLEMPTTVSVRQPDRMRIESRNLTGGNQASALTIVSDGDHTWFYLTPLKKYIKREATNSPEAALGGVGVLPKNLSDLAKSIHSVKLTGEETLDVGGEKIPCWVVETSYGEMTLPEPETSILEAVQVAWIGKEQGLMLQSKLSAKLSLPSAGEPVAMTQLMRTTALRLNAELPDSLFIFTPPAGAVETGDWTLPGIVKPDVVAKPAPEFRGQTLDGAGVNLAELRGKVVLLDFWATWCGPCKRDLPNIEKIYREFRANGLAVLGINVGEEKATVEKFLSTAGLTYPMVQVDNANDLVRTLSVGAFPTVVIVDREGNVATYDVGVRSEAELRADLAKLGVGAAPAAPTKPPK